MVRASDTQEIARDLVGERGHWIEERDGGRFAIFDPNGQLLGTRRTEAEAKTAIAELISTGSMSL